jgi:hypothetical protein
VKASHDALVDLFERIESFFTRLGVYTQVSLTTEMTEVFVKIVSEVLSILSIATKEVKRKRTSESFLQDIIRSLRCSYLSEIYFRKLLGRNDIEDALVRLENLINEEVRMAIAQTMTATIEHKDGTKPYHLFRFSLKLFLVRFQESQRSLDKQHSRNYVFVICSVASIAFVVNTETRLQGIR